MLDKNDVLSTVQMIDRQHLDIRTITMGISLLSCADRDAKAACEKIYDKITRYAEGLVKTGEDIPIVNKRISVTPMALVAGSCDTEDYVPFAVALDRAAKAVGVNFIGGFGAFGDFRDEFFSFGGVELVGFCGNDNVRYLTLRKIGEHVPVVRRRTYTRIDKLNNKLQQIGIGI